MKFTTALIALAATAAPLYARQSPAEPLVRTIAAVQQSSFSARATAEQRAAAFPALALLPTDVDAFIASAQNDTIATWLRQIGVRVDHPISASFGITRGSVSLMSLLCPIATGSFRTNLQSRLGLPTQAYPDLKYLLEAASSKQLTPLYLVISGSEKDMERIHREVLKGFLSTIREMGDCARPEKMKGMDGLTIDLGKLADQAPKEVREAIGDILGLARGRQVSIFCKLVGDKLVFAASENPEAIRIPSSAEESLLATDKCAALDQSLSGTPLGYTYISPQIIRDMAAANTFSLHMSMESLKALELMSPPSKGKNMQPMFASFNKLFSILVRIYQGAANVRHPSSLLVWMSPGNLHLEVAGDACGMSVSNDPLELTTLAADPSVVLYYEQNKITLPDYYPSVSEVYDAVEELVLTSLKVEGEQETLAMYQMVQPDLKAFGKGLSTMSDGLKGNVAFTLRENPDSILAGSVYCGVSDRVILTAGWRQMLKSAVGCGARFGLNPDFVNSLPIAETSGPRGAKSYTVVSPIPLPAGLSPNVMLSNEALIIGSNTELNEYLMNSLSRWVYFPGYVFSINPDAAARAAHRAAVRSNAPSSRPSDEDDDIVSFIDDDGNEEFFEFVDEGEDYDEVYTRGGTSGRSSDTATQVAENLAMFASRVGLITGAVSVKGNGTYKARIDVKIKD